MTAAKQRVFALTAATLLALTACASSTDTSGTAGPDMTTGAEATRAPSADDQRIADQSVFVLSDFPEGYESRASDTPDATPDPDEGPDPFEECIDPSGAFADDGDEDAAEAESDEFFTGEIRQATSFAVVAPGESEAKLLLDILQGDTAIGCFQQLFEDELADDPDLEGAQLSASIDKFDVSAGDEAQGFRVTIRTSIEGFEFTLHIDMIATRIGRVIVFAIFFDAPDPFPGDVRTNALAKLTARSRAAQ